MVVKRRPHEDARPDALAAIVADETRRGLNPARRVITRRPPSC